jgi:hypothetical protein
LDFFYGRDAALYFFISGAYRLLGCARNLSGQINVETAEIATKGTGIAAVYEAVKSNWSLQIEGLSNYDAEITDFQLEGYMLALTPMIVNFVQESKSGEVLNRQGNCILTSKTFTSNYNDFSAFNVSLTGTGPLTLTNQPFNPLPNQRAVTPVNITPAYGSTGVTVSAGVQVVAVRIGLNWYGVYSDGTPADSEHVSYDVLTGVITFPVAISGETVTVLTQNL